MAEEVDRNSKPSISSSSSGEARSSGEESVPFQLEPIKKDSTKTPKPKKTRKRTKSKKSVTSKGKKGKKDSTQKLTKKKAQKRLFELVSGGVELPIARAMVIEEFGYESNSTITKWFSKDRKFYEKILITAMAVAGRLQLAEMKAAKGGFLLGWSVSRKRRWYKDGSRAEVKSERSQKIAPPDIRAIGRSLDRRIPYLRKAAKAAGIELGEVLEEIPPTVPVDEEGRPLIPFTQLQVTFGTKKQTEEEEGD